VAGPALFLGAREQLKHGVREVGEAGGRLVDPRQTRLGLDRDVGGVGARLAEHLLNAPVAIDGACEQVDRFDLGVLTLVGEALRAGDQRLGVRCVAVEVDGLLGGHTMAKLARSEEAPEAMPNVKIFTTTRCGYCVQAKHLLAKRGIDYEEVDVTGDDDKRAWLVEATGRRTVPQIFIKGEPIGGYDDLAALDRAGTLAAMLAAG
jgi:glutaredoxin 3